MLEETISADIPYLHTHTQTYHVYTHTHKHTLPTYTHINTHLHKDKSTIWTTPASAESYKLYCCPYENRQDICPGFSSDKNVSNAK